jgi:ribonuclease BN (tRNA processing enzyme)
MLQFIGRGGAFNVKEGNNAAYIKEGKKLFLIDCGGVIFSRLMQKGLLDEVEEVHVAITHRHSDHVGSLGDLILYCYNKKNVRAHVYSDDALLAQLLGLMGIEDRHYVRCGGGPVGTLDMTIRFIPCTHAALYRQADGTLDATPVEGAPNLFLCHSLLIDYKGTRIFYSGDTNKVDWETLRDVDLYYVDTTLSDYPGNSHYNIEAIYRDCCAVDPALPAKIWCMHLNADEIIHRAAALGFNVVAPA